ncbi:MAG: hypothetical protein KGZ85_04905 [Ignavibacterium sp.]|nr:hypothetical protein [Ignavibacterium sp.]
MKLLNNLFFSIKKYFFHTAEYVIYEFIPEKIVSEIDNEIRVYTNITNIPSKIFKKIIPNKYLNIMFYRLSFGQAVLLCLLYNTNLIAYGWIQSWKSFKKKFRMIDTVKYETYMLGPFWTDSNFRGKGYYGRLIENAIIFSGENKRSIIYTSPHNTSSKRGIEKAGFSKIGSFRITFIFRFISFYSKLD